MRQGVSDGGRREGEEAGEGEGGEDGEEALLRERKRRGTRRAGEKGRVTGAGNGARDVRPRV